MDANALLQYLRGFVHGTTYPTPEQWAKLQFVIDEATEVVADMRPFPVVNPTDYAQHMAKSAPCGCKPAKLTTHSFDTSQTNK